MNCSISIIIPVYNEEVHLSRCLDSVLAQTHAELEVILVDDGSTDGSNKICREYEKKDRRIKLIVKEKPEEIFQIISTSK